MAKRKKKEHRGGARGAAGGGIGRAPVVSTATRHERSAGVVVYREGPAGREYLLLDYGRYWDLPKGHVEAGEDDVTAALRECREETGLSELDLTPGWAREVVCYFRVRGSGGAGGGSGGGGGGVVRKAVVFFLGRWVAGEVRLSDEHVGFVWLGPAEAVGRVKYPTARALLREAEAALSVTRGEGFQKK